MGGLTGQESPLSIVVDGSKTPVSNDAPIPIIGSSGDNVRDNGTKALLSNILCELKIMNLYNSMAHGQELTKEDVS